MRHGNGFGNCNEIAASDCPGQRNSSSRATPRCANSGKRGISQRIGAEAAERRIGHYRYAVFANTEVGHAPGSNLPRPTKIFERVGCSKSRCTWQPRKHCATSMIFGIRIPYLLDRREKSSPASRPAGARNFAHDCANNSLRLQMDKFSTRSPMP